MASYAVLILALTLLVGVLGGVVLGAWLARHFVQFTLERSERSLSSEQREDVERINEAARPKVTDEMLLAYGVLSAQDLPKDVKDAYGITPDDDIRVGNIFDAPLREG